MLRDPIRNCGVSPLAKCASKVTDPPRPDFGRPASSRRGETQSLPGGGPPSGGTAAALGSAADVPSQIVNEPETRHPSSRRGAAGSLLQCIRISSRFVTETAPPSATTAAASRDEPLASIGEPFAGRRSVAARPGEPLASGGEPFARSGRASAGRGEPPASNGERFASRRSVAARAGGPLACRGGPFARSGRASAGRGEPPAVAGKTSTGAGETFATASLDVFAAGVV
jgi:hypothetical protein